MQRLKFCRSMKYLSAFFDGKVIKEGWASQLLLCLPEAANETKQRYKLMARTVPGILPRWPYSFSA